MWAGISRKTLVLVGPPGVGRRSLISKIVNSNPSLFGTTKAGKNLFLYADSCGFLFLYLRA
jgi:putative ribosome biogenesis GTPase RsgA